MFPPAHGHDGDSGAKHDTTHQLLEVRSFARIAVEARLRNLRAHAQQMENQRGIACFMHGAHSRRPLQTMSFQARTSDKLHLTSRDCSSDVCNTRSHLSRLRVDLVTSWSQATTTFVPRGHKWGYSAVHNGVEHFHARAELPLRVNDKGMNGISGITFGLD